MKKKLLLFAGAFGVAVLAASFNLGNNRVSATVPGNNTLISVNTVGLQNGNLNSYRGYVSGNGEYVAFDSSASDISQPDWNSSNDVFVKKLSTGRVTKVSVNPTGTFGDHGSTVAGISETGRYILFQSQATDLISGQTMSGTTMQTYLRDMTTGTTTLISKSASGVVANAGATGIDVSSDGRFVLFASPSTNLGPIVTNTGYSNLYMLDRDTNSITMINMPVGGGSLPNFDTYWAHMSCDGSLVTFESWASNLVSPYSGHVGVFLRDMRAGDKITEIASSANAALFEPNMSCNGNYITFASNATNLDASLMDGAYHMYAYDRINGVITGVDKTSTGTGGNADVMYGWQSDAAWSDISDNGIVAFRSYATNLDSTVSVSIPGQLFVHNIKTGDTYLLTKDSSGNEANAASRQPSISNDGKLAAYESSANNLTITPDYGTYSDVYSSETGY